MQRYLVRILITAASVLLFTVTTATPQVSSSSTDQRLQTLKEFFRRYSCPAESLAAEFIRVADNHRLDWRLLPSLAFVESGGGKQTFHNNIFGWGSVRFASVEEGIRTVARHLAQSRPYRGKAIDQLLWIYNPVEGYRERVKSIMEELGTFRSR